MISVGRRAARRARREWRLHAARARWGTGAFGTGCDIRPGLRITAEGRPDLIVGDDCVLDRSLTIECYGRLRIGRGTIFGHHCTLAAKESITIGDHCLIAEMVSIRDNDHAFVDASVPYSQQGHVTGEVVIGDNVWLGSRVIVTRGVSIGDGAVIGAGAVVTRDIPSRVIAVGIPARVIREL